MSYNFVDSYFDHAEVHSKYENEIKVIRVEISRLIVACKDQEKILNIFYDKEAKIKEEINSLWAQLEDSKRNEEIMCNKKRRKNIMLNH